MSMTGVDDGCWQNMPYRRMFFEENQCVHIISRAIEERKIFSNEEDCNKFIFQAYTANIGTPARSLLKKDISKIAQAILRGEEISSKFIIKEHPPLVYFLDFSLVITHFHFYLLVNVENIVPVYMKKLNNSFSKYFNIKYDRDGTLFASRYKSIAVKTEFQSNAVSRYVGIINPLDVYQPGWREEGLKNWKEAFEFLKNYPFSSFPDKVGERRSKILAPDEILERYSLLFTSLKPTERERYLEEFVKDFLSQKGKPAPTFFLE